VDLMPAPLAGHVNVDHEIKMHWNRLLDEFPEASANLIARKVAEDWDIPVLRVLKAFEEDE